MVYKLLLKNGKSSNCIIEYQPDHYARRQRIFGCWSQPFKKCKIPFLPNIPTKYSPLTVRVEELTH